MSERKVFQRGSRKFSLVQGDAKSGWQHIFERHAGNSPNWIGRTKFPSNWNQDDIVNALRKTIKHGAESTWKDLTVFEARMNFKGIGYRNYKATINHDGTVRTFHLMEK